MSERLVVLATGGTGGHMFPAEALAHELLGRGFRVALITDRRGQAFGDRVPGVATHRIPAGRLGGGIWGKAIGIAEIMLGAFAAGRLLRNLRPSAVVGFGGYPSVPTMLAATRLAIPTLLHEQNALLGRANRLLAPRVSRIATSFPQVEGLRDTDRTRITLTGNPVRPDVVALRGTPYPATDGALRLLITGGSQGARILSGVIPPALALLPAALRQRLAIMQQARPEDLEAVRETHRRNAITAEVAPFFEDLAGRLAGAHLVIARSGASTVAELTVVGRPALLVPYRHAADDHQTINARAVSAAGAAWVMSETDFTPETLAAFLGPLLESPTKLVAAAAASRLLGRPDAARLLADLVISVVGANGAGFARRQEHAA